LTTPEVRVPIQLFMEKPKGFGTMT